MYMYFHEYYDMFLISIIICSTMWHVVIWIFFCLMCVWMSLIREGTIHLEDMWQFYLKTMCSAEEESSSFQNIVCM